MSSRKRPGKGEKETAVAGGGGDDGNAVETSPVQPSRGKFGVCQALSVFLIFVILCIAGLVTFLHFVPMHIHSCEIYVPHKIEAVTHLFNSIFWYGQRETFGAFWTELTAAIYSEGLNYQAPIMRMGQFTQGKHLLMVGGTKTPTALNRAAQLGVKLTIIDDDSVHAWVHKLVGPRIAFLPIKNFGKLSVTSPELLLEAMKQYVANGGVLPDETKPVPPPIQFDGIFTLVEDHGPLTSFLGEGLGLKVSPYKAAVTARSKLAVRQAMAMAGLSVPRFAPLANEDDVDAAGKKVGFPAFLKPVYGVQATFAAKVSDEEELIDTLRDFQTRIDTDHHPIYYYGKDMILESLMKGSEVQLELMLNDGKVNGCICMCI